jgi:hypothetical protein
MPEALIASMLDPTEFGSYYALGAKVHSVGEAIFFEVDPGFRGADFPFHLADERCVVQPNGALKSSVYLGIYDVLARIPVAALGSLHLVTDDGRTLELERATYTPGTEHRLYLYQEFCPVTPLVASRLEPLAFCRSITDRSNPVQVPRIVFSDLQLGELAVDPATGSAHDLPYPGIQHLRDVLIDFEINTKDSKLVMRQVRHGVFYRSIESGFFVGDHDDFGFYPFPSRDELESRHYQWWRSAQIRRFD